MFATQNLANKLANIEAITTIGSNPYPKPITGGSLK